MVNSWSKVYINQVFFIQQVADVWYYEVEFSKPKPTKPIPEGTVKVYFTLIQGEGETPDIEFHFENESLVHRPGHTMRANMYESWINNVLENKLKVQTELHLGTEFEHTRIVDEKGAVVDPFVPAFEITKVKNLDLQKRESQKTNVESPRFVSTLRRALQEMFAQADRDNSGKLSYSEFRDAFRSLSYGLNDNDINMMVALADENEDESIDWREFVDIGVQAIKTIYARNFALEKQG
jgi:hypothetical protein